MMNQKIPTGMTEKEYFEVHASQEEFLEWYHQQELPQYEKPSVTVDMVAYCFVEGKMKLFLIRRKAHPFQNCLALVGGFMDEGEDAAHLFLLSFLCEMVLLRGLRACGSLCP